jgi:mRNA-degrading endonuclease toxin of MazEF toxin-antitoxin module
MSALIDRIRLADKARLVKKLGRLKPATMLEVGQALAISLGMVD